MSESATSATQNNMTTCLETFEKDRFSSFPHRHGDATGKPATRDKTRGCRKTSISYETSSKFEICEHHQTGWNVRKCHACHAKRQDNLLGNIRRGEVFQLPYRHGDATGKPATRDKTRGCRKTSISHETSGTFHSWLHDKRTSFAASPIDTARPRENQRRETRQVGAPKRAFRARLPPILIFSTRYQTGWNVRKCHVGHAKQHDNLPGNIRKGQVFQLPP